MNKNFLFLLSVIFFHMQANAQRVSFTQCTSKSLFKVYNNDTVLIGCDTVYILSKKAYGSYFKASNGGAKDAREIINSQMEYMESCDKEVERKQKEYDLLKSRFDSLANKSIATSKSISDDLKTVNDNLSDVKSNIASAQSSMKEASDYIVKEKNKSFLKRLGYGLGGFAIGVVVTTILIVGR